MALNKEFPCSVETQAGSWLRYFLNEIALRYDELRTCAKQEYDRGASGRLRRRRKPLGRLV